MAFWGFYDYITEDHKCPIADWWGAQPEAVQTTFDLLVKTLSETQDWEALTRRKHKVLTEEHEGMCELMFSLEGIGKFRLLGLWRRERCDFIFLGACRKTHFFTIPPQAFDDAYTLMKRFEDGRGGLRRHV